MTEPRLHEQRALDYALSYREASAKEELRELDRVKVQDLAHCCTLLAAWADDVFGELEEEDDA